MDTTPSHPLRLRRVAAVAAVVLNLVFNSLSYAAAIKTPTGRRPSIMLIISDDMRYDAYLTPGPSPLYTQFPYRLPSVEQSLLRNGVMFEYAYANFPSW